MTVSAFTVFPNWRLKVDRQEVNFLTDTINASLMKETWTPNITTQTIWGDVSTHECADAGYVMQTLASKTIALDGSNRTVWDAADLDFGNNVSLAGKYLLLWRANATAGQRYLMAYADLNEGGGNLVSVSDDFDFAFSANGIFRVTPNA
jgi:hypothetical protein